MATTAPHRIDYKDTLKIPFGCKILHSVNLSKSPYYKASHSFIPIDEYEEDT